jgi:hypothetical protein
VTMNLPTLPILAVTLAAATLAACATPGAQRRENEWRSILAAEAPIGAPASAGEAALRSRGIEPQRGTYTEVRDDGSEHSLCPDPKAALTGREAVDRVGAFNNIVAITICLDQADRIASHHVGIWIQ